MRATGASLLVLAAASLGCSVPSRSEQPRASSSDYRSLDMWLCRPDLPESKDACRIALSTTVTAADGTRTIEKHAAAPDAPVDCFYVYPTVDLNLIPGNHVDFGKRDKMVKVAALQIARFSEVCKVYAPLYRQATISTYIASKGDQKQFFDVAYSDVAAAFRDYLAHADPKRPFVIIGHSQGSQMAARLVHDEVEPSAELRARLLVAMTIGFAVNAPRGAEVGGTLARTPPCMAEAQTGCVVAYRTIADGDSPSSLIGAPPGGQHALCVDPSYRGVLRESVFERKSDGITTPYESVRDFYRAQCKTDDQGNSFLALAEARVAGDKRPSLVDLGKSNGGVGMHIYDVQLGIGDLVEQVRVKARNWAGPAAGDTVKP